MIGFGLGGVMMGRLSDRFGIVVPALLASLCLPAGMLLSARAAELWQFSATLGLLCGLFGMSATFAPVASDISHWFTARRGLAVGIVISGTYVAGAIWPPVLQHLIDTLGWRETFRTMGLLALCTMPPLGVVLYRRAPVDRGGGHAAARGSRRPLGFSGRSLQGLLCIAGVGCCTAMAMPQVHVVPLTIDLGFDAAHGARMLALMLGFGVVSRLVSGWISDRIGGLKTLLLGSMLQGLVLFAYLFAGGLAALYVLAAAFGLSQGGIVPSYTMIIRAPLPRRGGGMADRHDDAVHGVRHGPRRLARRRAVRSHRRLHRLDPRRARVQPPEPGDRDLAVRTRPGTAGRRGGRLNRRKPAPAGQARAEPGYAPSRLEETDRVPVTPLPGRHSARSDRPGGTRPFHKTRTTRTARSSARQIDPDPATRSRHRRRRITPGEMGRMPPRTPAPPEPDMTGDERPFRFFDNREKYLLFVTTCSEKWAIGQRIGAELEALDPKPPALRVFDAGTGDGTVMASVLRQLHGHYPTVPFLVVGKEISLEDVRLTLEKLPDRFSEHPQTVVVLTNLHYREAPALYPADETARARINWREVALDGRTAHELDRRINELRPTLADWWKVRTSPKTGNPVYVDPSVIVLYRSDHRFALDAVIPRPRRAGRRVRPGHRGPALPCAASGRSEGEARARAPRRRARARRAHDHHPGHRPGPRHGDHPQGLAGRGAVPDPGAGAHPGAAGAARAPASRNASSASTATRTASSATPCT